MGWQVKMLFFDKTNSLQAVHNIVLPLRLRCWPGNWLMQSCNGTFFPSNALPPPPLVLYLLLVCFRFRSLAFWAGTGLLGGCSSSHIYKLLDAILLPVKAGTGTDAIFTYGVQSPLHDERHSTAVTFFPLPQKNENRLNHGKNLTIINLRDQASHDSGKVPFKKT